VDDNLYVDLALQSEDFDEFCDLIEDTNKEIEDAFNTLEPWLFDWHNKIMQVKVHCGHDEWGGDSWGDHGDHDDEWGGDSWDEEDMDSSNGDILSYESLVGGIRLD
jgi:hypothetical protein